MSTLKNHSVSVRVYYEDTDASGVAYHANYLRWFERCRTEWLRAVGFSQERLKNETGIAFTLSEAHVKYRVPARLDDELKVQLDVTHVGRASIRFAQKVERRSDGMLLAEADFRVACVDMARFRPCAVPAAILKEIQGVC